MSVMRVVEFDALIRDVRHRDARAASDLAEWLEFLNVDGKSERTLYGYDRELGFDLEERQLLMGHEHVTTTQRYYGHLTVEDVARKMEEVGL